MKRPWKNRLIARFFLTYLLVILLFLVSAYFYSGALIRNFYISSLSRRMYQEAKVSSRLLPTELKGEALDRICRELARDLAARLTVIAPDGTVLGDSHEPSATMETHGSRPEVVEALARGEATSTRYSTTVQYDMLYQSFLDRLGDRTRIVRVSVPLDRVEETIGSIRQAFFLGLLLLAALGSFLAYLFSSKLTVRVERMAEFSRQVAQGRFLQPPLTGKGDDEISILEKNLNEMSQNLRDKIKEIVGEKEKAESILRCMMEGVIVVDTQGRVILLNDNARKMFHLDPHWDSRSASLNEVSRHPEMRGLMDEVLSCDCSRECFTKEMSLEDSRWLRVNAVSLREGEEKTSGYVLVFHDISEIKRLETVRADFVANVSHELRTPLTAIRGYAETLLESPPANSEESENFLRIIQRHCERLGRLIDDLLTLSDLESGKIRMAREHVNAAAIIEQVLEIFRDQVGKKEIALSGSADPGLPPILGDPDRLQQLLINLIDNAIKYTPPNGRVRVTARCASSRQSVGIPLVELDVEDTGYGIPEKDLPRLTERFYRVDKARSRELGGTGLGLAIVKYIVQAHHGTLKIESQLQKGTTVRVLLPAAMGGA